MAEIFERNYDLRTSDFDCFGSILPGAVLDIFQDIAGRHSQSLKVGVDDLKEKNLIWVLVKVRFEVLGKLKMHQQIKVKTWPLPPSRVTLRREYLISDEEGNLLIKGASEWAVVHIKRRRIMPALGIYNIPDGDFCTENAIDGKLTKIHDFTPEEVGFEVVPRFCDIDVNGHVNNTKYANFVMDAIPPENKEISSFQIDYHREVLKGCRLIIHTKCEENDVTALGKSNEGETMFSCKMSFK